MYNTLVYLQTMKSYTPQYTRMVDWWKNETSENMAVHRLSVPQYVQAIDLDWSEKLEADYLEVPDTALAGIAARPFYDLPFDGISGTSGCGGYFEKQWCEITFRHSGGGNLSRMEKIAKYGRNCRKTISIFNGLRYTLVKKFVRRREGTET